MSFLKNSHNSIRENSAIELIDSLARAAILELIPYASARSEFAGKAKILLDANENTLGSAVHYKNVSDLNRYPDPMQLKLRSKIAKMYSLAPQQIFVGNGSDEAIDLLLRVFCEPKKDAILITPPTYGMYEVIANVQGVSIQRAALDSNFSIDLAKIKKTINLNSKIVFACSPNNPTANLVKFDTIKKLAKLVPAILVVDEAYIDFANQESAISLLKQFPNVVVLRTLSKAWGMAGIRVGFAIAHPRIISLLQKIKFPYNVSSLAQSAALDAIQNRSFLKRSVAQIKRERVRLSTKLRLSSQVLKVYHSDSSFLLVKFKDSASAFNLLLKNGIVTRDRSQTKGCESCLRISVGTREENDAILATFGIYSNSSSTKNSKKRPARE